MFLKQLIFSALLVIWHAESIDPVNKAYKNLLKQLVNNNEKRMETIIQLDKPTKFDFEKLINQPVREGDEDDRNNINNNGRPEEPLFYVVLEHKSSQDKHSNEEANQYPYDEFIHAESKSAEIKANNKEYVFENFKLNKAIKQIYHTQNKTNVRKKQTKKPLLRYLKLPTSYCHKIATKECIKLCKQSFRRACPIERGRAKHRQKRRQNCIHNNTRSERCNICDKSEKRDKCQSSRMRRKFKKECKNVCRHEFKARDSDLSSSASELSD